LGKTMAQLPLALKNKLSHRGQAAAKAAKVLERLKDRGDIRHPSQ
jgi:inosine/xanthosine triphosphate pyrophosphatase family protein